MLLQWILPVEIFVRQQETVEKVRKSLHQAVGILIESALYPESVLEVKGSTGAILKHLQDIKNVQLFPVKL